MSGQLATARPSAVVRVVAVAGRDCHGAVLIACRPAGRPYAGYWELPGGKVEPGESSATALARESREELGVAPRATRPLIRFPRPGSSRDDARLLEIHEAFDFEGEPMPQEGQTLAWAAPSDLARYTFLPANGPILNALRLPRCYRRLMLDPARSIDAASAVKPPSFGPGLLGVRPAPTSDPLGYRQRAERLLAASHEHGTGVLAEGPIDWVTAMPFDGIQLTPAQLSELTQRPLDRDHWVAATCRNGGELRQALALDVDFIVLGPVRAGGSEDPDFEPNARPLGWRGFAALTEPLPVPVYATGGLTEGDETAAIERWAQGVATQVPS